MRKGRERGVTRGVVQWAQEPVVCIYFQSHVQGHLHCSARTLGPITSHPPPATAFSVASHPPLLTPAQPPHHCQSATLVAEIWSRPPQAQKPPAAPHFTQVTIQPPTLTAEDHPQAGHASGSRLHLTACLTLNLGTVLSRNHCSPYSVYGGHLLKLYSPLCWLLKPTLL